GGSRVVNIDLRTGQIAPGGDVVTAPNDPNRADELAYAPELGLLLVINNADAVPFGTFISVNKTSPHRREEDYFHCRHQWSRTARVEPSRRPVLSLDPIDIRNDDGPGPDRSGLSDRSEHGHVRDSGRDR